MEKRNTNRQREHRDEYRQHSPAWIRAQRRKRKRIIRRRIMIGTAVICIVLVAGVVRIFSGGKSHGKETEASAIEESTFQASDISVNGISLKGMTRSEAKAAIEKEYPWKVTITYNGESIDAENLIDSDLDAFLDGICTGKAEGEYTFAVEDSEDLQSAAAEAAADAAAKWDVKAKNGSISEYDAATDKFLFADGTPGKAVNQEKLIKDAEKMAKEQAEQEEKEEAAQPPKEVGFISVSVGKGMTEIFKELGVDYLIEGGQTMNPSTEDMLNAIAKVNAKTIYIFPNNKNIVLAANQARDLTEDKEIVVVPTKTIPQGITAMISYVPEKNSAENTEAMLQAIEHVKTGQITYAVRDTRIDDKEIHEGDMMGIGDHGILAVGKDRMEVAKETVAQMVDDESEVISIYYGADTEEAEAEELATALEEAYPDCDVELNAGGQPIYYYVISVE